MLWSILKFMKYLSRAVHFNLGLDPVHNSDFTYMRKINEAKLRESTAR